TRALLGGVTLSRQRGFVHEEVCGTKDAEVGRDGRARREADHIARYESVLRQVDLVAVAQDRHPRLDDRQQLGDRMARPKLRRKPSRALPSTIARTITPSVVSPRKRESVIANSSRITSGLRNWFSRSPSGVILRM